MCARHVRILPQASRKSTHVFNALAPVREVYLLLLFVETVLVAESNNSKINEHRTLQALQNCKTQVRMQVVSSTCS